MLVCQYKYLTIAMFMNVLRTYIFGSMVPVFDWVFYLTCSTSILFKNAF